MDLSATIHLLGEALGEVLRAQESVALFETEEHIRALAKARRAGEMDAAVRLPLAVADLSVEAARATASAFAVYFDLINLAEEVHRIQALRARERAQHPAPIGESIGEAIARLAARGVGAERMAALLRGLRVELVLTAHPTEAKRAPCSPSSSGSPRRCGVFKIRTSCPGSGPSCWPGSRPRSPRSG